MNLIFAIAAALSTVGQAPAKLDFDYPIFVAVGPDKAIYVADQNVPAVFKIGADGVASTIFHGSKKYRTPVGRPRGLAVEPGGSLLVCDPPTLDVFRLPAKGPPQPLTGVKTKLLSGIESTLGEAIIQPEGVAVAPDGTAYVTDLKRRQLFKIPPGKPPVKLADVWAPRGIAVDKDGSLVVVSHSETQLVRIAQDGKTTPIVVARPFAFPMSVAVAADGRYLVTDNYGKCLWAVSRDGKAEKLVSGEPLVNPTGVAVDVDGRVIVADPHAAKVFGLSKDLKWTVIAEGKRVANRAA